MIIPKEPNVSEKVCTASDPWDHTPDRSVRVVHPDAVEVEQRDGYPGGDYVDYECPHCKHQFSVELPQ